jgi:16S rRNA (cytidine1402-2'-O)-methyltransferase
VSSSASPAPWSPLEGTQSLESGLYVVSTPIGNLRDITLRALDVLHAADILYAEDTRVTARLLQAHGIKTRVASYHDHNAAEVRPAVLARLAAGERVALVSDAGTPLVSDPGFKLVEAALEAGFRVLPVPGASAVLAGLVIAGLPSDRFLFAGFLPAKAGARRTALAEVASVPATLVFYETGPRLAESLADMAEMLGPRPAAVARELTKLFEECRRGELGALAQSYADAPPKGEIVVLVGPPLPASTAETAARLDQLLTKALATLSVRAASLQVAAALGLPRREVYNRALALKGEPAEEDGP